MAYRSDLETRLAKKTTRAVVDYQMIEDGDRVMVGLSGGKDSWALLQILDVMRQRAPVRFSLVAVNVDSGTRSTSTTSSRARARRAGGSTESSTLASAS
jgi:tRNA(Ile)-lysidine synthase TilS/MesJ